MELELHLKLPIMKVPDKRKPGSINKNIAAGATT
jgi:hypothetical protein